MGVIINPGGPTKINNFSFKMLNIIRTTRATSENNWRQRNVFSFPHDRLSGAKYIELFLFVKTYERGLLGNRHSHWWEIQLNDTPLLYECTY